MRLRPSVLILREHFLLPEGMEETWVSNLAPDDMCHSGYSPVFTNGMLTIYRTSGNDLLHSLYNRQFMTLLVTAECVDDLLNDVHQAILTGGLWNTPTKGANIEILGAT